MRRAILAALLVAASAAPCRAQISAEGALFYDRGHYWIELAFRDAAGRDTIPPDLSAARFEITKLGEIPDGFKPSRVEAVAGGDGGPVVILSSGRLEGRSCYRVAYRPAGSLPVEVDSICDPFFAPPEAGECGGKAFFKKYVAPAFRKDGDGYNLNQFKYEYDFSDERTAASFALAPSFKTSGFALEPFFEESTVAYSLARAGKTATGMRAFGASVTAAAWVRDLRFSLSIKDRWDRSAFELAAGDSVVRARSLVVEGRIRFDNLFDRVNRYCLSVFKGVDLGLGCAWYRSGGKEAWSEAELDRASPFMSLRTTWTFLYGFQLSYQLQSFWPSALAGEFTDFHSVRFGLLLRDALSAQAGKAYHPDVEFAYDSGRRLPLFEKEEKVSIGFTFALYPW